MKTNQRTEIEDRLRRDEIAATPSPEFHHRIMRAVRDDRAAEGIRTSMSRTWPMGWLVAAGAAAVVAVATAYFHPRQPFHPPAVASAENSFDFTALTLAQIAGAATSPVDDEVQNLREDAFSAAGFLVSCLPSGGT